LGNLETVSLNLYGDVGFHLKRVKVTNTKVNNHLVQQNKQHYMKVLLSSFYFNGSDALCGQGALRMLQLMTCLPKFTLGKEITTKASWTSPKLISPNV